MNSDASDAGRFNPKSTGGGLCVTCGSTLGFAGPDGGCLNCLARFALSPEAGEFDGATDDGLARTFGHFEILTGTDGWPVRLGRGAMGVTYRARDTVLHTEVALKVISGNVAGHPSARAAFLREARAAARLRHPNVATVFHYGEQDGQCFYVMELVEGETLESRLRREGPQPPALVLEIGRQVACALMEAEAVNMVHRDLKPSNIMFVARRGDASDDPPHIKVIDFGLAQAMDLAGAEDGQGETAHGFVGTPSFASPEQFARGDAQRVDTRSDIYSLGVTLWTLLCGKLPFDGSTLTSVRAQQTRPSLPLAQLQAVRVPAPVVALLQNMLQADPRKRPSSARALIDHIQRCQATINPGGSFAVWGWPFIGLVLLVLGLLATIFLGNQNPHNGKSSDPPPVPADRSVAVLPFENLSPDESLDFYSTGVHDQIAFELANIAQLKVVASGDDTAPPGKRDLGQIARDLGVIYLVEGSVWRAGDQTRVKVSLVDTQDASQNWSHQYEGPVTDEFKVQRTITRELTNRLRATLTPAEDAALNEPPTTDPLAYDLYLRAYQSPSTFNTQEETRRGFDAQVAMLEQAVARDRLFVAAWCALAAVEDRYQAIGSAGTVEDRAVDHRTKAEVALQNARRLKPDDGMVHQAYALHFFQSSFDNKQARFEIDLARKTLPNNAELEQTAGLIARSLGDWDEAVRCFVKADSLQPREPAILGPLSWTYRNLRNYAQADRTIARLIALKSPANGLPNRLSRALLPMEERADLEPLQAALAAEHLTDAVSLRRLAISRLLLALLSHDPDAVPALLAQIPLDHPFISFYGTVYPNAWFEGLAARMRGDEAAARAAFEAARVGIDKNFQADPTNDGVLAALAVTDAGAGHKEEAIREGKLAYERIMGKNDQTTVAVAKCQLATVYAWTGERDLAFALLDELAGGAAETIFWLQVSYGDLRLNPMWDPLRNDPRFATLTQRLAPRLTP